jgi:hypothetical protein
MSTCNRLDLQTLFNKHVAGAMVVGENRWAELIANEPVEFEK